MRSTRLLCHAVVALACATAALADTLTFTESRKTKPLCGGDDEACEYPLVGKFKLKATIDLPAGSGAPRFGADTPFELKFAGIDYEGTLGDDPRYRVGRKSCRLPIATVEDARGREKVVTVAALTWTSTRLTVTVSGKLPEEVVASLYDGEETADIEDEVAACVHLGDALVRFDVAVSGKVTTVEREIRDGDGDVVDVAVLSTINVRGTGTPLEATDAAPSVTIASVPSSPTFNPRVHVQAYADEDLGVERMAYRLDGGPEVELSFSDGAKPGTSGEADCEGARRATTSFEVELATEGNHTIQVIAYDGSEQSGSATAQVEYRALRIESVAGAFALDERGLVWSFGAVGAPTLREGIDDVERVFAHDYALRSDGSVWRLRGSPRRWERVTEFDSVSGIVEVLEGYNRTFALTESGEVWGLGANWTGALGDGSLLARTSPVRAQGLVGAERLTQEWFGGNPLAVTSSGAVYAWGHVTTEPNQYGNPGAGSYEVYHRTPTVVPGVPAVRDIAFNGNTAIFAAADGTLRAGGYHIVKYPGDGRDEYWDTAKWAQFPQPSWNEVVTLAEPTDAKRVHADEYLRWVIAGDDDQLWVWGDGSDGQFGDGVAPSNQVWERRFVPYAIPGMTDVAELVTETGVTVLKHDGTVWCWGRYWDRKDDLFQTGEPGEVPAVPVQVSGLPAIAAVGTIGNSLFDRWALGTDGTLWKWAMGRYRYQPERIPFVP